MKKKSENTLSSIQLLRNRREEYKKETLNPSNSRGLKNKQD